VPSIRGPHGALDRRIKAPFRFLVAYWRSRRFRKSPPYVNLDTSTKSLPSSAFGDRVPLGD
jgi:hypothetical protein